MENTTALVLTAETLELKIGKKELGALTTNALDIKAMVEKILPKYDIANYNESNIDSAKKDKALLNNSAKALNDKRIEIEKEWMIPFNDFKGVISDTCKLIKTATDQIDSVIKLSEQKAKDSKKSEIELFFKEQNFNLVSLDRLFDEKWLNKTSKMKDIQKDILDKISKFKDDLITIEAIGENVDLLKSLYLDTLNLNTTIQYANTLKVNAGKVSQETNLEKPAEELKVIPTVENIPTAEQVPNSYPVSNVDSEILIRVIKISTTYDKMVLLGNFMNENDITFEKIENE